MAARGIPSVARRRNSVTKLLAKILARMLLVGNLGRWSRGPVLVTLMGHSEHKIVPFAYWTEVVPYCFDCWEPEWPRWESFFRRHRTRLAFFTARQSADHFRHVLPSLTSVWLPEAVNLCEYQPERPLKDRNIDVLEFGRKFDQFHNAILAGLNATGRAHQYERVKGAVIFKTNDAFRAALGDSKISVCFPGSMTHPERSGGVETATRRYFESIASKCVLVGRCPQELTDLFGYNPVVEIETGRELEQVNAILSDIDRFQPLVEKNYARLREKGSWKSRVSTILEYTGWLASDTQVEVGRQRC
jgi:hypothetical protein